VKTSRNVLSVPKRPGAARSDPPNDGRGILNPSIQRTFDRRVAGGDVFSTTSAWSVYLFVVVLVGTVVPPTGVSTPRHGWITDRSGQKRGEKRWPPMGRSGDHQWGLSMAASGEIPMATVRCGAGSLRPLIQDDWFSGRWEGIWVSQPWGLRDSPLIVVSPVVGERPRAVVSDGRASETAAGNTRTEDKFRGLLESAPDAMVIVDGEGDRARQRARILRLVAVVRRSISPSSTA
jgi:hypothetical protein